MTDASLVSAYQQLEPTLASALMRFRCARLNCHAVRQLVTITVTHKS